MGRGDRIDFPILGGILLGARSGGVRIAREVIPRERRNKHSRHRGRDDKALAVFGECMAKGPGVTSDGFNGRAIGLESKVRVADIGSSLQAGSYDFSTAMSAPDVNPVVHSQLRLVDATFQRASFEPGK